MERLKWGVFVILILVFVTQTQAQNVYWRHGGIVYQWPYDGLLGGLPDYNSIHFLNYVPNPDYKFLNGPLYNGYLTFALSHAVSELEVTLSDSTPLNHNWINGTHTATGLGLSGDLLTTDSHFMLDPLGLGTGYTLIDQYESPTEISFHALFDAPVDFFAVNLVGTDASAFSGFIEGSGGLLIVGDGAELHLAWFIPEPATLSLLALGGLTLRRKHSKICS